MARQKALVEFENHWNKLRGKNKAPLKDDFQISNLPGWLWKFISLIEIEDNPRRFLFKVFSTANVEAYGEDVTGKYLDEIDLGGNHVKYSEQFDEARLGFYLVFEEDKFKKEDGNEYGFEGGCFPFLKSSGKTSHLVLVKAIYRNNISYTD